MPTAGWLRRVDLPVDAAGRRYIDPDNLDQILDQFQNWRGNVNGGGNRLSNATLDASVITGVQTPWLSDINAAGFRLVNTGNVGIGTASPTQSLDLVKTAALSLRILSNSDASIMLREVADSYGFTIRNVAGSGFNVLRHSGDAAGISALFIGRDTGNVGIGTASPVWPLHVRAASHAVIQAQTTSGVESAALMLTTPARTFQISNRYAGVDGLSFGEDPNLCRLFIAPTSGNVGIGTVSPAMKGHLFGPGVSATAGGFAVWDNNSAGSSLLLQSSEAVGGSGGTLLFGSPFGSGWFAGIKGAIVSGSDNSVGDIVFLTRGGTTWAHIQEVMRITFDGNVGIGQRSPSAKLDVSGDVSVVRGNPNGFVGNDWMLRVLNYDDAATKQGLCVATTYATDTVNALLVGSVNAGYGGFRPWLYVGAAGHVRIPVKLSVGDLSVTNPPTFTSLELLTAAPYIDFKTSGAVDFDCRILQTGSGASANLTFCTGGSATSRLQIGSGGAILMWLGGSLKTLSVDGSGFVKAT